MSKNQEYYLHRYPELLAIFPAGCARAGHAGEKPTRKKAKKLYGEIKQKLKVQRMANPQYFGVQNLTEQLLQQMYNYCKSPESLRFCFEMASPGRPAISTVTPSTGFISQFF